MKYVLYLPILSSVTGFIILLISLTAGWIGKYEIANHLLFLFTLLTSGVSILLLKNSGLIHKKIIYLLTIAGLLFGFLCSYNWIELAKYWSISFSMIVLSLILGLYNSFLFKAKWIEWFSKITCGILILYIICIAFQLNNRLLHTLGSVFFLLFALILVLNLFVSYKKNSKSI
jgi:hypothetical protein